MKDYKLKNIKIENLIWIIYIFFAIFGIIANELEKYDILTNKNKNKKNYGQINLTILVIALIIYIYFVYRSYNNFKVYKESMTKKDEITFNALLIAALLFLAGGIFAVYAEINNKDEVQIPDIV